MLCGAGGAYAVANLGPDASDLPVVGITEPVQALPVESQLDALASFKFNLYRTDVTRSTDTIQSLFKRLGIDDAAAAAFIRNDPAASKALLGKSGRNVTAEATNDNALAKISVNWLPQDETNFARLVVEKTPTGFKSHSDAAPMTTSSRLASGVIRSSLFAATDEALIPDTVATQLAEMFSGDIDFRRALRKGDRFSLVYETLEVDGEAVRTGRVLSAEFVNNGKTFQAVWFQEPGSKGAYYTLDGQSTRRAYLSAPLEFSRISSNFSMRFHPILQKWKQHLGTDFAAATGTPVRTVGDGVVEFAGVQNGFGNVIFIKHRNGHETVYAHLSRIDVRKNQAVSQGERIGAVGQTGWATGPHLHFEFRVNGHQEDPMTIARQSEAAAPITAQSRPTFNKLVAGLRIQLDAAATLQQASAR